MTKLQISVVIASLLLFGLMYFGFDTKPKERESIDQTRAAMAPDTDIDVLLKEARSTLPADAVSELSFLEKGALEASEDSIRIGFLRQLSSRWYQLNEPAAAGFYAEKLADLVNTEAAWSIAGTTYSICVQREKEERASEYCNKHAVKAFESAISLNPENIDHRVNLALCYTEKPPQNNPMKGILMLVDLNKRHPDNVPVMSQLGRLAIQTGQYEKAIQRLSRAVELEPESVRVHCLLAQALEAGGRSADAEKHKAICSQSQEN